MWPVEGWQSPLVSITVTILAAAPFWLMAEACLSRLRPKQNIMDRIDVGSRLDTRDYSATGSQASMRCWQQFEQTCKL